jgi:hypothetical protein
MEKNIIASLIIVSIIVVTTLLGYSHDDNDLMSGSTVTISLLIIPIFVTLITSVVVGVIEIRMLKEA